jgi:GTP-binding protein Era
MSESASAAPEAQSLSPAGKAGLVAVIGRASVGKSSLVNAILGEKVSIVSAVPQTTRNAIRGILTEPRGQIVFVDTPGVHKAGNDLGKLMNKMARASVEGADAIVLVLDGSEPPRQEDLGWMSRLKRESAPLLLVLNKADLQPSCAAEYRRAASEAGLTPAWLSVSAATGLRVTEVVDHLFGILPESPLLFPEDILTDFPRKLNIADIIREKLFAVLRDELPHSIAVWVENVGEGEAGWEVEAVIYVSRASQKGIVIGEKGRLLRRVRRAAEPELSEMYGRPVTLSLWVKVEPHWMRNFWLLKRLGYAP